MIVQFPNAVLTRPSEPITDAEEAQELAKQLVEAYETLPKMKLGLAAPQIGINKRMAIVLGIPIANLEFKPANQIDIANESCFSVAEAKEMFTVERPKYGWATWLDPLTMETHTEKVNGIIARVFQHELDHLNGVLCHKKDEAL